MAAIFMVSNCTDCCTSAHIFHTLPLHGTWTLAAGSQPANILLHTLNYVIVLVMDNNISLVNVLTQNSYVCIFWTPWKIQYPLCYNARTELICVHILSTLTLVIDHMFVSSCIPEATFVTYHSENKVFVLNVFILFKQPYLWTHSLTLGPFLFISTYSAVLVLPSCPLGP